MVRDTLKVAIPSILLLLVGCRTAPFNYSEWIQNLEKAIRSQLSLL